MAKAVLRETMEKLAQRDFAILDEETKKLLYEKLVMSQIATGSNAQ